MFIPRLLLRCSMAKTSLLVPVSRYSNGIQVPKVKRISVSKGLVLRTVTQNNFADSTEASLPPLVVLFEWLGAKSKAVDKYCKFYHDRGLDVLTVKGGLLEFLWPSAAFTKARGLLDYLQSTTSNSNPGSRPSQRKYLIHAFSVGAYNHTVCLMVSKKEAAYYGWYRQNICGSVFDSIVIGTLDNMVTGMALSLSNSPAVQVMVKQIGNVYYRLNPARTLQFYDEAVTFFKTQPVLAPSLYLFSHDDPMSDERSIHGLIELWKQEFPSIQLSVQSWEHSVHAAHIRYHEAEYKAALDRFCKDLDI
ncbi:uncharacterized protein LOC135473432 [Liolophura sinensis]|uniref:uncharacterized protein LOC135473432 n=1 Tax=Liolophura sinensis TaxID=3198878 RepID=UPI0031581664